MRGRCGFGGRGGGSVLSVWRRDVEHERDLVDCVLRKLPDLGFDLMRILQRVTADAEEEDIPDELRKTGSDLV